jgi:glycosyltransferase involved in cell wall biosynthesis
MKFSTITPLYDGRAWIRQTLDSIFAQTVRPDEVIVVDDGSTDGSAEIVRQYPRVRWLQNPERGANAARRFGLEQARHPLVALIDQDDVWHPEHLQRVLPVLEAAPDTPAVVAGAVPFRFDAELQFAPWGRDAQPLDVWSEFPMNPIACTAQVLFRRQLLLDLGGWDVRYPGVGAFHAWLTLSARRPFLRIPGQTVGQRLHANSQGNVLRRRNRWDYCDRYLSAAQNRVALRLRYHPTDSARVKTRLRVARHLFAWRFADAMLSPRQTAPMATVVDQLFADESMAAQQALLEQAFQFFPVDERSTRLRKAVGWIRLYHRCPGDARHLRSALRQHLQRRFSESIQTAEPLD